MTAHNGHQVPAKRSAKILTQLTISITCSHINPVLSKLCTTVLNMVSNILLWAPDGMLSPPSFNYGKKTKQKQTIAHDHAVLPTPGLAAVSGSVKSGSLHEMCHLHNY